MAKRPGKKAEAEASARDIARRLGELPRPVAIDSEAEWVRRAGVSSSFFTNLRNGSDPSVNNLRQMLAVVGSSLPEFFADEARGALASVPNKQALERAFLEALGDGYPKQPGRRAEYLAEVVQRLLGLPEDRADTRRVA